MRIDKAEKFIEAILEKYPRTRTSDHLLYRAYHYELMKLKRINVNFETFFTYPEKYDGVSFATVERCRRKLQQYRQDLKAPNPAYREYKQEEFKNYARR